MEYAILTAVIAPVIYLYLIHHPARAAYLANKRMAEIAQDNADEAMRQFRAIKDTPAPGGDM